MIEIVPARLAHVRAVTANMRAEDREEVSALGVSVRGTVLRLYRDAIWSRAALIDGEAAAIWGLNGALASFEGFPWLFTTPLVERVPLAFFRVTKGELARMLATKDTLVSGVAASYERSIRTWQMLGFELGEPQQWGAGGALYHTLTLRRSAAVVPFRKAA